MLKNIKKFITVIILLAALFTLVGCKKELQTKVNPNVTGAEDVYAQMVEGNVTYKVSKGKVYSELKSLTGVTTLVNLVSEDLLKDYIAKVTDEQVDEKFELAVYGEDFDYSDLEAKEEKQNQYLKSIFETYGINTDDLDVAKVKMTSVYKLEIAKKAYAAEKLEEEIKAHNEAYAKYENGEVEEDDENAVKNPYFLDEEFVSYYENNNENEFWAIVIPFASYREFEIALAQKGIQVKDSKWEKAGVALTNEQVKEVFVELYKDVYNLTEEVSVNKEDLTSENEFYYTESELRAVNNALLNRVKDFYGKNENGDYSVEPEVLSKGAYTVAVYKLQEKIITAYEDLDADKKAESDKKAEESLKEADLTSKYINTKLYELFAEKGIEIYDTVISNGYMTNVSSYGVSYTASDKESTTVVAVVNDKEYTADKLFAEMDKAKGITIALSELVYERALNNPEINKYYDTVNKTWKDDEMKATIEQAIQTEKDNFENGTYNEYGYSPESMTFEEFMNVVYSAKDEEALLLSFLYEKVVSDYQASLIDFDDKDSTLWEFVSREMNETKDKKFTVTGIHLLICAYENATDLVNGGSILDFEEWNEKQVELADELYALLMSYVKACKGTYETKFKNIQKAFDNCPITSGEAEYNGVKVNTTLTSEDGTVVIDVQKYKKAGLYAKFENLGSFSEGKMVEAFEKAVKEIWDQTQNTDKSTDDVLYEKETIKTEFGYHLYVNLSSTKLSSYTESTGSDPIYVPTKENVLNYIKDADSIDSTLKPLITTYYSPISTEITGQYLVNVLQYTAVVEAIAAEKVSFKSENYKVEDVKKLAEMSIDNWFENNLTYVEKEDLSYFK